MEKSWNFVATISWQPCTSVNIYTILPWLLRLTVVFLCQVVSQKFSLHPSNKSQFDVFTVTTVAYCIDVLISIHLQEFIHLQSPTGLHHMTCKIRYQYYYYYMLLYLIYDLGETFFIRKEKAFFGK